MDRYEQLANAIILQAVRDYRDALKNLRKHPQSRESLDTKEEAERFFRSQWYRILTAVNGEMLIERLQEEAGL